MTDNHQFVTVTRTLVKRGITDIERKLVAALVSGGAGYALIGVLGAYNITLPSNVAELVPYASAILGGYLAHSLGSVTTVNTTPAGATEVSTSTGSIKIPTFLPKPTPPAPAVPVEPAPAAVNPGVDSVTAILAGATPATTPAPADPNATAILDPNAKYSQAAGILSKLPSANPVDAH